MLLLYTLFGTSHAVKASGVKDSLRHELLLEQNATTRCTTLIYYADLIVADSFSLALDMYKEASKLADDEQFYEGIAMVNNSLMTAYTSKGAYSLALEYGQKSLSAAFLADSHKRVANSCINLGNIYFYIKSLDEAMQYYKQGLIHLGQDANPFRTSVLMLNIGAVFQEMNRPDSAIHYFELSMAAVGRMDQPSEYMYSALHNNVGNLYLDQRNFKVALGPLQKALDYATRSGDQAQIAAATINVGLAYTGLRDWKLALGHLQSADTMVARYELSVLRPELLDGWAFFYETQGQYEKALGFRKQYELAKDSLEGRENKEAIAQLQTAYDSEMQRDRIALLEYERQKHEEAAQAKTLMLTLVAIGLGMAVLISVLLFLYYRKQQRINLVLEELSREKDGLISIVAHDLKSPLNKTKMLVELIHSTCNPSPEQEKLLGMIDRVCTDGGTLIQDLLEITQLADERQPQRHQQVELQSLIANIADQYGVDAAKKQIQIQLDLGPTPISIHTDRHRLERILDNLVSNAIKFSKPSKSIYLALHGNSGGVNLVVRDEGPGIGLEDQKKLFGKFQKLTARPTAGESSNGLGLSIVKALVERLGGQIDVKSTLGVGTEFIVRLPASVV